MDKNKKNNNFLKVEAFKTSKNKVKKTKVMKNHIIPMHPFRMILSGASGSGKSNLLLKFLCQKEFYKNYFDAIFIISPTASAGNGLDDSYAALMKECKKTKLHIVNDLDPDVIEEIMSINKKNILENEVHKSPRLLIVYDDVISHRKFMTNKSFLHSFVASRHYNASVIICSQKFNAIPRTCRLQANAICFFRGTNGERECLASEFAPAGYSKREMEEIIDYATAEPYSFLYWNQQAEAGHRFRKNLDTILKLKK